MIIRQLQYEHLHAGFLLLLLPLFFYAFYSLDRSRKKRLGAFAQPEVLHPILTKRLSTVYWIKSFLCCFVWTCAVIALMGPKGNEHYAAAENSPLPGQKLKRQRTDHVIILIDASASMQTKDAPAEKEREAVAKEIADGIVSRLKGENVAVYAFTSATIGLVPLTNDYLFTRLMISQLHINEAETAGTDFKQLLEEMKKQYLASPSSTLINLVLLSDGGDTALEGLEGDAKIAAIENLLSPLQGVDTQNLHIYTIGIGSKKGANVPGVVYKGQPVHSALEEALLRRLSSYGNGTYYSVESRSPISITQSVTEAIEKERSYADQKAWNLSSPALKLALFDHYFPVPLALALAALALALLLPDTRTREKALPPRLSRKLWGLWCLFCSIQTAHMYAADIDDNQRSLKPTPQTHVQREMRSAENLFQAGEFGTAINRYQDALDYPLARWQTELIHYNIGTVLLAEQQWNSALAKLQAISTARLPPALEANLQRNIALAHFEMAKASLTQGKPAEAIPPQDTERLEEALLLFLQFHLNVEAAKIATCRLSQAIGEPSCQLPNPLSALEQQGTRYFAELLNVKPEPDQMLKIAQEKLLEELNKAAPASHTPEELLKRLIARQDLSLTAVRMQLFSTQQTDWGLKAQQNALELASQFSALVLHWQKEKFETQSACQKQPWEQVMPLFISGKEQAEYAEKLLTAGQLSPAQNAQLEALLKWKEALALLQKPVEKEEQTNAPEASQQAALNSTLQQMEEEDQSRPMLLIQAGAKQPERPW
jgi:Ca-activated chloride channel homolog